MGLIYLYDYCICNEDLLEEFDKEGNVAVVYVKVLSEHAINKVS